MEKGKEIADCFKKYIGVYGCHNKGDVQSFINDIPGINNELLSAITDSERNTYKAVFEKALTAGVNSLMFEVKQVMYDHKNRHEFGNVLFETEQARVPMPLNYDLVTGKYVGILHTTAASKYVNANISTLSIQPREDITVKPVVFDFEKGKLINEGEPIELKGGVLNVIDFDYSIECEKTRAVFFGFELEGYAELAQLSCNRFVEPENDNCFPCESVCGDGRTLDFRHKLENVFADVAQEYAIYTVSYDDFEDVNSFKELSSLVCADLKLECSMQQFVCANAKELSEALIHLVASNILTEKIHSKRQNLYTVKTEDTYLLREEQVKEFKRRIKLIAPKLTLSGESLCWDCVESGVSTYKRV